MNDWNSHWDYFKSCGWIFVIGVVVMALCALWNSFAAVLAVIASFFFGVMYCLGKQEIEDIDKL